MIRGCYKCEMSVKWFYDKGCYDKPDKGVLL